ncbi:DUF4192 family protein [Nocardioides sambongensis]|uniref:DUF4192 family protein n=1 Tax=Nocardioides sambongensis TaxID=2589074 RepID=UPI0015E86D6D|nr:DUF4192 family protein [Nocardioides sambongensis]
MSDTADDLAPPLHLTARSDEDLVALAPVLLGFWPDQDIVMLTFGAAHPFHARVDLPPAAAQSSDCLAALSASLLVPAVRHGVQAVVLLCHTEEPADLIRLWPALADGAAAAGIPVLRALALDGTRMRRLDGRPDASRPARAVRYDVSAHPFVVRAMVEGRIGYRSRAEMVRALAADPAATARVAAELADLEAAGDLAPVTATGSQPWTRGTRTPSDREVAELLLRLRAEGGAGAQQRAAHPSRGAAVAERRFWATVLPRTPEPDVVGVATALALAAWRSGDGAMAWVALDRALEVDPDHEPALVLTELLERAVPPQAG